jgi:hypothetical protein
MGTRGGLSLTYELGLLKSTKKASGKYIWQGELKRDSRDGCEWSTRVSSMKLVDSTLFTGL